MVLVSEANLVKCKMHHAFILIHGPQEFAFAQASKTPRVGEADSRFTGQSPTSHTVHSTWAGLVHAGEDSCLRRYRGLA